MDHSLAQGIGDFHLPHKGYDRAVAMRLHAAQCCVRVSAGRGLGSTGTESPEQAVPVRKRSKIQEVPRQVGGPGLVACGQGGIALGRCARHWMGGASAP